MVLTFKQTGACSYQDQFLLPQVEVDAKKISLSTYNQKTQSLPFLFRFGLIQIKNDTSSQVA